MKLSIGNAFLLGLPDNLVSDLISKASLRRLRAGEALFQIGDDGDGCYHLEKGVLKVVLMSPQGDERILAFLPSGAIVGDLAMIDALPRSASVIAVTECEVHFIGRSTFERLVRQHPEIHRSLVKVLAARLREADDTIASLHFLTMKGRVARVLLDLAADFGEESHSGAMLLPAIFHQKELAALAGIARENVSRILSDFERRGLVTKSEQSYQIEDKAHLEREIG